MYYDFPDYEQMGLFTGMASKDEKPSHRYLVGYMNEGGEPIVTAKTSLKSATDEFNCTPASMSVSFLFDTLEGDYVILLWQDWAALKPNFADERSRLHRWLSKYVSKTTPKLTTQSTEKDLSDPISRAAYDGFIRKGHVR